jgi:hypothetical protein
MNNNRILYFMVAFFLFSSVNAYAQSESQEMPLLTQQIDRGEVLVLAESTAALVPSVASVVPLVSNATASSNCGWLEVPCYHKVDSKYECDCHFWSCSADWTEGACPIRP